MRLQQLRRTPDLMMEIFRCCRHIMEMIITTLGYHLTFEIESETSAVNPTISSNFINS